MLYYELNSIIQFFLVVNYYGPLYIAFDVFHIAAHIYIGSIAFIFYYLTMRHLDYIFRRKFSTFARIFNARAIKKGGIHFLTCNGDGITTCFQIPRPES